MDNDEYTSFDTLRPHFDALARVGYYKIVLRTPSKLHLVYRVFITMTVVTYNLQHIIKVCNSTNTDEVVDTLFILLTTINTLAKQFTFNVRCLRMDKIIEFINGPSFAISKPYHDEVMRTSGLVMCRLLKLYHFAVYFCGFFWFMFPIVNRVLGEDDNFTGYIPFDTGNNLAFGLALTYMSVLIMLQAYGNVTMDCTIVALYSQARSQVQILRYDLEHLTDEISQTKSEALKGDEGIQRRFVRCVEHHKSILWFVKEIQSIFSEAMVLQFLIMAWVICMTLYKIANLNILSAEFVSMTIYLLCMMAQLFIYCYFGSQLTIESEFINQSLYSMDWLSLSPRFRRQLLMMMQYCFRPITLTTAYIVPMSLDTYIKVLRSSYTLFTFLNR